MRTIKNASLTTIDSTACISKLLETYSPSMNITSELMIPNDGNSDIQNKFSDMKLNRFFDTTDPMDSSNCDKHIDQLLQSYLNQDGPGGPAFNLFTEIGYDPHQLDLFNHK
ncbi:hypothetical protein MXB_1008 [Myxobolus squamalis]|nr:hypothetical protein MXB_1008 [Myxobolus squamalis]